jgi:TRAP-type C4-dicarboxylate transport system substrate-binding protein
MRTSIVAALAASVVAFAGAAGAQTEWKFNNSYAPTRVESGHVRDFAADVKQRSGGRLTINVLEGGAMGLRDADALRWMQAGTPELGFIWPPFLGRDAPDMSSIYVYGVIGGAADQEKALPTVRELLIAAMRKWEIEPIGFMGIQMLDASLFCRQPVRNLDELKRVKLRVGTREQVDTFKALGVAAQIVPQQELYSAMQTGVVDCALYPARIIHTISLQEVAKHAVNTRFPFPPTPYVLMANQAKFRALPADLQQVLRDAAAATEKKSTDYSKDAQEEKEARDRLTQQGVTFHPDLPETDRTAIIQAAAKTWETIATESKSLENRAKVMRALGRDGS